MTKKQAEIIDTAYKGRPAPANDFVTKTITMTREEWRAIVAVCRAMEMESPSFGSFGGVTRNVDIGREAFMPSSWEKMSKATQ